MKIILIDSNVYGWALEKEKVMKFLERLIEEKSKEKPEIIAYGCFVTDLELLKKTEKKLRKRLEPLYKAAISGIISKSTRIENLADIIFEECKSKIPKYERNDARIIACGMIAGVRAILTENRKTMANPEAVEIYSKIAKKKRVKLPQIADVNKIKL